MPDTKGNVGTKRTTSSPSVARTGRDSGFKQSGSIGVQRTTSTSGVKRGGRGSGTGQPGQSLGIKKSSKGPDSGSPSRIKDGVNQSLGL